MKKTVKRVLALVSALMLCAALMLPGLAATVAPRSCNHVWNSTGPAVMTYAYENPTYHTVNIQTPVKCNNCGVTSVLYSSRLETHNGPYCTLCHRQIVMSILDEIMGVNDEYGC